MFMWQLLLRIRQYSIHTPNINFTLNQTNPQPEVVCEIPLTTHRGAKHWNSPRSKGVTGLRYKLFEILAVKFGEKKFA